MSNMNGIPLESGVNDCHWVCNRKCTNPILTRNKIPKGFSRDWDSKRNCVVSLTGTIHCFGFKFMHERQYSSDYKFIRVRRRGREDLRQVISDVFNETSEERVDSIEADILEALGIEF